MYPPCTHVHDTPNPLIFYLITYNEFKWISFFILNNNTKAKKTKTFQTQFFCLTASKEHFPSERTAQKSLTYHPPLFGRAAEIVVMPVQIDRYRALKALIKPAVVVQLHHTLVTRTRPGQVGMEVEIEAEFHPDVDVNHQAEEQQSRHGRQ